MKDEMTMTAKPKPKKAKQKKATNQAKTFTSEQMYAKVRDIAVARKMEIQENAELSEAICEFVDKLGEDILAIMDPAIKTGTPLEIQKDKLLVLQLLYLRLCGEVLETGHKIETESDIPSCASVGVEPINTKMNNVPMFL